MKKLAVILLVALSLAAHADDYQDMFMQQQMQQGQMLELQREQNKIMQEQLELEQNRQFQERRQQIEYDNQKTLDSVRGFYRR